MRILGLLVAITSLATAGCVDRVAGEDVAAANLTPAPIQTVVVEGTASYGLAVGVPCVGGSGTCDGGFLNSAAVLPLKREDPARANLTLAWEPTGPTAQTLEITLAPDGESGDRMSVTNGLTIEVPVEILQQADELWVSIGPSSGNVLVAQEALVTLSLDYA